MIPIHKGAPPAVLTGDGARFQDAARKFALTGDCDSKYKTKLTKNVKKNGKAFAGYLSELFTHYSFYSDPTVKRQLIEEHHGKCVFCECFIMDGDVGDVEHFRPKAEVTVVNHDEQSDEEKVVDHPGYFWLSQTWDNLFLSCKQCNQRYKGNFFDVVPGAVTGVGEDFPRLRHDRDVAELPYLLDPRSTATPSPRVVIRFNPADARAYPREAPNDPYRVHLTRAARTIELVGLNRRRLVEARANHLLRLRGLFVLAAHSGGVQPDLTEPANILSFQFRAPGAGSDAVEALKRAVLPSAEFSALAQDAIETWNAELNLLVPQIPINHQLPNQIRVNTRMDLRLEAQLQLAEKLRAENATPTLAEAEPDTSDLDRQYNALLKRYQDEVKRLRSKLTNKKIEATQKELGKVRARVKKLREQIEKREDRLAEIRAMEARAVAAQRLLAWSGLDQPNRRTQFGTLLREHQVAINDLFPRQDVQGWKELLDAEREIEKEYASLAQALTGEAGKLEKELKKLSGEEDALVRQIREVEAPLEVFIASLMDLYEDAFGIVEAYKNCGADTQKRVKRAVQLRDDASNLIDVLDGGEEPSETVAAQMKSAKQWPPRITKV
ncbi:MAG TPA: hypothetical protein VF615_23995 [Longimicrobiaceae bacterium]|jgi:hypothetical protein